jgi:hypothetical protein
MGQGHERGGAGGHGGLLHDGRVRDPHEIRFLERKLAEIEAREAGPSAPRAPVR